MRKKIFKLNIHTLLRVPPPPYRSGTSAWKRLERQLGIPKSTLNRWHVHGLVKPDYRSRPHLEKLVEHFHLPSVESLWEPMIVTDFVRVIEHQSDDPEWREDVLELVRTVRELAKRLDDVTS